MTLTRIVRTGLSSTVSTPAIAAQWTKCVAPRASAFSRSPSSTSASWSVKFGCAARSVPESAFRWRLSTATISLRSTSSRASVVAMKPAPPVIRIRLPSSTPAKPTCRDCEADPVTPRARRHGVHLLGSPVRRLLRGLEAEAIAEPLRPRADQERLEPWIERREHLLDPAVEDLVAGRLSDQNDGPAPRRNLDLGRGLASEPAVPLVAEVDDERVAAGLARRLEDHGHARGAVRRDGMR